MGFVLPIGRWLKGPLRSVVGEMVDKLESIPKEPVIKLLKQFENENEGVLQTRIMALVSLSKCINKKYSEKKYE